MKRIMLLVAVLLTALGFQSAPVLALSSTDTADLKITNIEGSPRVTFYKIAEGEYTTAGDTFIKFNYARGINNSGGVNNYTLTETGPTTREINAIARGLMTGGVRSLDSTIVSEAGTTGSSITHRVTGAGVYLAILTQGKDGRSYNPILLAASYNGNGSLIGGNISAKSNYLHGDTAVAKSSLPAVSKEVVTAKRDTTGPGGNLPTATIGDVVSYAINLTLPSYSPNSFNKTLFVSDRLSDGLTLDYSSLALEWNSQKVTISNNTFTAGGVELAKAERVGTGFNMVFNYDNLRGISPKITYKAVLDKDAVAGTKGNVNNVDFYYTSNPNTGTHHTSTSSVPSTGEDPNYRKVSSSATVYTYSVAFKKVDSLNTGTALKGAVFGLYEDQQATKLIDLAESNVKGHLLFGKVATGTYYVKEVKAPEGYSLNTTVYPVEVNWNKATTLASQDSTPIAYETQQNAAANPTLVGITGENGIVYNLNNRPATGTVTYFKTVRTLSGDTTFTPNSGGGAGVVMMSDIKNTRMGELPSTGGMGTYLFTFVGALVMAVAAGLFMHKRKQA